MSEQNQMAISPITAGLVGAAAGAGIGFIPGVAPVAKGYKTTSDLLTLEKDKFEALKSKVEASDNADAKAAFKKLEDGRTTISQAGDALVKEQADARKAMNDAILKQAAETDPDKKLNIDTSAEKTALDTAENKVKNTETELKKSRKVVTDATGKQTYVADDSTALGKAVQKYRDAYKAEVDKIIKKQDSGLGKDLKELEDSKAGKSGDELKAIEDKIKAKRAEIGREALKADDVKTAKAALDTEKAKIVKAADLKTDAAEVIKARKAYNEKLISSADDALNNVTADRNAADGTLAKLKSQIADWKATLNKTAENVKKDKVTELVGENGALKDFDIKKLGSFLEKSKGKAAAIGAAALGAAGVAISYIIGPKNSVPTDVA